MININLKKLAFGAAIALFSSAGAFAETVTLSSPENFQVLSVSPNGKWACGVYVDAYMNTTAFRWNLEGGSIELLDLGASTGWDVANDGTVSGDFDDTELLENGVGVPMPGFWRDGAWHHLEVPAGGVTEGMGAGISPDGQYMIGSLCNNGIYTSYIWKNGKIHRTLKYNDHNVFYAVSPDGNAGTGWIFKSNRVATYWDQNDNLTTFTDSKLMSYSPWNYGRNFSPDGSKLVYWGGWELDDQDNLFLYCIYDIKTGERIKVPAPSYESDLEFFDISNSGLLVGYDRGRGYVYSLADGQGMFIDDYLEKRGVDLSNFPDFYDGNDGYQGMLPIYRVVSVSEDDKVFAMNYYDKLGQSCSMILKIDQDLSKVTPAELTASQLDGLSTVQLKWKRPVGVSNIRGYNVYRDGKKVSGMMAINVPYFYDRNLAPGTYTYEVSAITVAGVETKAEPLRVEVKENVGNAPSALFARQKGVNNAHVSWLSPLKFGAHKNYFDLDNTNYRGFSIYEPLEVELGIAFDKSEMANYSGHKLTEVSFVPMAEHNSWAINVYSRGTDGKLQLVATQPVDASKLKYKELNTVKFTTPVDLPSADLIVVIDVMTKEGSYEVLGSQLGAVTPGYSDLLRRKGEDPEFMSAYESSLTGWSITAMSWAIDLGLTPDNYDGESNEVKHYNVYVADKLVGSETENSFVIENLADGKHSIGVEAVYANSVSPRRTVDVDIVANYPAVDDVTIKAVSEGGSAVVARWNVPEENDLTTISYSTASRHSTGIQGHESNGYAFMAASEYPGSMLRGYNGYKINSLKFYPMCDAIFTFMIYENNNLIYEYEVPDFTIKSWNEYVIPEDIIINENATYQIVIDCFDPEPATAVLGVDNAMPRANQSDLYSVDNGETWNSLSVEASINGNWMMGMTLVDPEATQAVVDGYDVVVDGKVSNSSMLTQTTYTHDFGTVDTRSHRLSVNVYYPAKAESVAGKTTTFKLSSLDGVSDVMIANIVLRKGANYIEAEGDGVKSMTIYSTSGTQVVAVKGNRADISGLTNGVYVVKMNVNGTNVIRKINILR